MRSGFGGGAGIELLELIKKKRRNQVGKKNRYNIV